MARRHPNRPAPRACRTSRGRRIDKLAPLVHDEVRRVTNSTSESSVSVSGRAGPTTWGRRSTMAVTDELLDANARYAGQFTKVDLPLPPARHIAVLGCMDARIDPAKALGLQEGDAHVIRNAGGRASDDALRSLAISHKLLGTQEFLVIHHTNCGMQTFTNEQLRDQLRRDLSTNASG